MTIVKLSSLGPFSADERRVLRAGGSILREGVYWVAWRETPGTVRIDDPECPAITEDELIERTMRGRRAAGLAVDAPILDRWGTAISGELIEEE
jgi:hypothetical protein